MKQMNVFSSSPSGLNGHRHYWKLFVDGASRNNPGPSGAGVYIIKDDTPFMREGYYLGSKTNNQAEYLALLIGLFHLQSLADERDFILVVSDSQLLIRQLQGQYRVKHQNLKGLFAVAQELLQGMRHSFAHVLREKNEEADRLANLGIDKKKDIPSEFVALMQRYEITL